MRKLAVSKNSRASAEGRQAFLAGLDILEDNPYNMRNIFGTLPLTWFEWHDGHEEEYQKAQRALEAFYES